MTFGVTLSLGTSTQKSVPIHPTGMTTEESRLTPQKPCCTGAVMGPACTTDRMPDTSARTKTSDLYHTCNLPKRFEHPYWFYGYGVQRSPPIHPCYRTTSSEYGRYPPSVHTVPKCFYPNTQEFTNNLVKAGMYRNYSLNTGIDHNAT